MWEDLLGSAKTRAMDVAVGRLEAVAAVRRIKI
jgi:hypothetical protein